MVVIPANESYWKRKGGSHETTIRGALCASLIATCWSGLSRTSAHDRRFARFAGAGFSGAVVPRDPSYIPHDRRLR